MLSQFFHSIGSAVSHALYGAWRNGITYLNAWITKSEKHHPAFVSLIVSTALPVLTEPVERFFCRGRGVTLKIQSQLSSKLLKAVVWRAKQNVSNGALASL